VLGHTVTKKLMSVSLLPFFVRRFIQRVTLSLLTKVQ
jgi:hypothetical protein